jgi:hypothetical protein
MLEAQREPTPRADGGELETALAFLDFARACLLKKLDGLDDEQLRRRLVVSETTLLGLVQHRTAGEHWWFAYHLAGDISYADVDFSMAVPPERTEADVVGDFRAAVGESNVHIAAAGSPDALTVVPVDGDRKTYAGSWPTRRAR